MPFLYTGYKANDPRLIIEGLCFKDQGEVFLSFFLSFFRQTQFHTNAHWRCKAFFHYLWPCFQPLSSLLHAFDFRKWMSEKERLEVGLVFLVTSGIRPVLFQGPACFRFPNPNPSSSPNILLRPSNSFFVLCSGHQFKSYK